MFVRVKGAGPYRYLWIVENHREGKRVVQRVLCTLGKVSDLMSNGGTDALLRSLARFGEKVWVVEDYGRGKLQAEGI